ncbi:phage tail protein [Streptomyces sp. NPDC016845]|uniref:phage tail protein n=1 Tax=Streptomyces sp. NPDC016845 TaxID=3364972 RepID=UPI0037934CA5
MSDDVTITVTVNNQTGPGFRDINGALRDARGRFAADAGAMSSASNRLQGAAVDLKASLMSLAPALIPVAAQAAPIVTGLGAAGAAAIAFTAAVVPQIGTMSEAVKAHSAYEDEVKKSGATSEAAVKKQAEYARQMAEMPKATRNATASYMVLSDTFKSWSDRMAGFTMKPVEQGLQITTALLPKMSSLTVSASRELTRLTTLAGGAVASPGFDRLAQTFSDFTDRTLDKATDGVVHFMRVLSSGNASGPFTQIMQYARENGPAVRETMQNLSEALLHVLDAASQVGPGMLTIVNAFAQLVSAVPAGLLANLMQVYAAFKLIRLAGVGMAAVGTSVAGITTSLTALRAASVAAGGGLVGLRAAFLTLGTAAKATVVVAGVAAAIAVVAKLATMGQQAAPSVDKLTSSLGNLGRTGKVTGEAAKAFGSDLGGLADSLRMLARPDLDQQIRGTILGIANIDTSQMSAAKKDLDAVDKSLASLVKGGNADIAQKAFDRLASGMKKGGLSTGELRDQLDDYKSALADQAFEQELAAQSMGIFGAQAQATGEKLAAQKASADGLRQSIEALNDVNRSALGGMIGFEASVDAAAKAAKENANSLNMVGGQLDLNSPKAQAAATALNDLAAKTKDAATSARESGASWERVNGIYSRGREAFIASARAMGLSKSEAAQLAAQIMKIPASKSTSIKMRTEDAVAGLNSVIGAIKRAPNAKSVTVRALTSDAVQTLRDLGYKVTRLKDGRFKVTASTGAALGNIRALQAARDRLQSKSITFTTTKITVFRTVRQQGASAQAAKNFAETARAFGGPLPRYADGGNVQAFPAGGYVQGPGSGTSDSIVGLFGSGAAARVSNTEYVVQSSAVRKYGLPLLEALNSGRLKLAGFAKGGPTKAQKAAAERAKAERQARSEARSDLTISHFGQKAGYKNTEIRAALGRPESIGPLVSALNQWRSTIMKSTHGGQERSLLRMLDSYGKRLISQERALTKVNDALDKAKSKLSDLKSAAAQLADSVKNSVLSSANITKGPGDGPTTVKTIMAGLTASRDKASAFSQALAGLKKKGLSSTLIQQIAEAGIDGGGLETAGALMGASKSEITSLNKLQSQVASSAKAAGATTGDAVYGAQIKASQTLVTTLTKQQTKLEKSMDKLAASIERSMKRMVGSKWTGGITGAASGGARGGLTWVGEHGPELARLPYGSRVYPAHTSRRMAGEAAGPGTPMTVVLQLDGQTLARVLVDPLRGEVRRVAGGNVQRALGWGAA